MIKKYYNSFLIYSKKHFQENKKLVITNLALFFGLIIILVLIDQLTKTYLFTGTWVKGKLIGDRIVKADFGIIGIRSVDNPGVTFFGDLIPTWGLHLLSIFIFIICSLFAIYSHDKLLIIAIAFTFSGTLGNFIDRVMFDGTVKDIIFIPLFQKFEFLNGTFNFADAWLFIGSIIAIIYIIVISYNHYKNSKFNKK